jgi:hypothetical protein
MLHPTMNINSENTIIIINSPLEQFEVISLIGLNVLIFIILTAIIIGTYLYTYFNKTVKNNSLTYLSPNRKVNLIKLASAGALVPAGNQIPNNNPLFDAPTTVVELTDAELNELLQILFAEIGNSHFISIDTLQSLGLYTDTIVFLLTSQGFIIF